MGEDKRVKSMCLQEVKNTEKAPEGLTLALGGVAMRGELVWLIVGLHGEDFGKQLPSSCPIKGVILKERGEVSRDRSRHWVFG